MPTGDPPCMVNTPVGNCPYRSHISRAFNRARHDYADYRFRPR